MGIGKNLGILIIKKIRNRRINIKMGKRKVIIIRRNRRRMGIKKIIRNRVNQRKFVGRNFELI